MDGDRFDDLTKRLTTATSRRHALRTIGGGLLAGVFSFAARGRAGADVCRGLDEDCSSVVCCTGLYCDVETQTCAACSSGLTACGGACTNTDTDVANCGTCGNACPLPAHASAICVGGKCGMACHDGFRRCGESCIPADACCDDGDCATDDPCIIGTCVGTGPRAVCRYTTAYGSPCGEGGVCVGSQCCIPESVETTCRSRCGTVTNNCGQQLSCGGCPAGFECTGSFCLSRRLPQVPGVICPSAKFCNGVCCKSSSAVCAGGACCMPEPSAKTCAGKRCGQTTNNCGQAVHCSCPGGGSCVAGTCVPNLNGSCFTAATRIAMADGTSRPIEEVEIGDRVLGRDGSNRVLAIHRPTLGHRPLYAFNGGVPFVTAGHPFLTERGWKAIEPAESEVPDLELGRLAVGDRILTLAGVRLAAMIGPAGDDLAAKLEGTLVTALTMHAVDPGTALYHLSVDGDNTYVANDFLVHNKKKVR